MSNSLNFEFDSGSSEKARAVVDGLHAFNVKFLGEYSPEKINLYASDESGTVVAGLLGNVLLGWFYIDVLWVHEDWRGQDVGSSLMNQAISKAKEMGAERAYLDTMAFQAAPFYEKLGFRELMRFEKFANGYDRIVMLKDSI